MGILEDFDIVEVRIKIKPATMDYQMETGTIKLGTLYSVLKDIVNSIEDGSFTQNEGLNVYPTGDDDI